MQYFYRYARDPISSFTHWIGMCCAAVGSLLLIMRGLLVGQDWRTILCSLIFGLSLIALYAASTLYHFYQGSDRVLLRLRKLDHSIIYVLIAGSYTPIVWHGMEKNRATLFLGVIWLIAVLGILVKLCWLSAPRWLYTSLYLLMGWAIVFDWNSFGRLEPGCLALVAAGGIAYSAGAAFYLAKRPVISEEFGFHEIFHLLILAGSLLHFLAVFFFVL